MSANYTTQVDAIAGSPLLIEHFLDAGEIVLGVVGADNWQEDEGYVQVAIDRVSEFASQVTLITSARTLSTDVRPVVPQATVAAGPRMVQVIDDLGGRVVQALLITPIVVTQALAVYDDDEIYEITSATIDSEEITRACNAYENPAAYLDSIFGFNAYAVRLSVPNYDALGISRPADGKIIGTINFAGSTRAGVGFNFAIDFAIFDAAIPEAEQFVSPGVNPSILTTGSEYFDDDGKLIIDPALGYFPGGYFVGGNGFQTVFGFINDPENDEGILTPFNQVSVFNPGELDEQILPPPQGPGPVRIPASPAFTLGDEMYPDVSWALEAVVLDTSERIAPLYSGPAYMICEAGGAPAFEAWITGVRAGDTVTVEGADSSVDETPEYVGGYREDYDWREPVSRRGKRIQILPFTAVEGEQEITITVEGDGIGTWTHTVYSIVGEPSMGYVPREFVWQAIPIPAFTPFKMTCVGTCNALHLGVGIPLDEEEAE